MTSFSSLGSEEEALRNSENASGKKTYSFLLSGSLPSVGREENAKASFRSNADDIGLDWVSFGERQTVLTKQEFAHVRRLPAIHPRNSGGASGATAQPSSPIASMAPAALPLPRAPFLLPRRAGPAAPPPSARPRRAVLVRAQPDTSTSATEPASEFMPPPGFKPPKPQRFAVKEGQLGSIFGASLAIPFRLGTGIFVLG
jgi:hypothetical protein